MLLAGDSDVCHALWAIWGTDAACYVVEILPALRVPESTPLLAAVAFMDGASSSAIRVWFITVRSIVPEFARTVLPADRTDPVVAVSTEWIAEGSILLLV